MVEVFKTNVTSPHQAKKLVSVIEDNFQGYQANFDLEDCDRILRVAASDRSIETQPMITLLRDMGVVVEVLSDHVEDMNSLVSPRPVFFGFGFAMMMAMRKDAQL